MEIGTESKPFLHRAGGPRAAKGGPNGSQGFGSAAGTGFNNGSGSEFSMSSYSIEIVDIAIV